MLANVLSWCGSRLGGSAPIAARSTPPRRGVSAARTSGGASTTPEASRARRRTARTARAGRRDRAVMGHPRAHEMEIVDRAICERRYQRRPDTSRPHEPRPLEPDGREATIGLRPAARAAPPARGARIAGPGPGPRRRAGHSGGGAVAAGGWLSGTLRSVTAVSLAPRGARTAIPPRLDSVTETEHPRGSLGSAPSIG